ncbi:hypothetical protein [Nocardioides sp. TF02-7]|uniref:hypothetical protein n=1 Tax=Nocardioides sp. TF02-7 TaxID=2917724 RepID=UPI001F06103E|nr:hypothetical protein [Nocardioides sp. TF02-7]UMG93002.1 hypothetical protein MF408_01190 [Nocardioides sp. TF02-7]
MARGRGERGVVRRLRDAEVGAGDDRERDLGDHLQGPVDHAVGPVGEHPLRGHEHVLHDDVVARRAAHAEGVPVVRDADALGTDRDRHVEDAAALLGVVEHEHRRHHGAVAGLAGEPLAPGDAVAAVDRDRLAAGMGVVAAAGRDEEDPLVRDPAERGLRARQAAAVAPGRERDHVLVHRAGQRGGAAVAGELALQGGQLGDRRAVATELDRDGRLEQAGLAGARRRPR